MGVFDGKKVGLREEGTHKLLATYPYTAHGSDKEVEKTVRDWYYSQGCGNEDQLRYSYVDIIKDEEQKHNQFS